MSSQEWIYCYGVTPLVQVIQEAGTRLTVVLEYLCGRNFWWEEILHASRKCYNGNESQLELEGLEQGRQLTLEQQFKDKLDFPSSKPLCWVCVIPWGQVIAQSGVMDLRQELWYIWCRRSDKAVLKIFLGPWSPQIPVRITAASPQLRLNSVKTLIAKFCTSKIPYKWKST